jgi:hypothetical protein
VISEDRPNKEQKILVNRFQKEQHIEETNETGNSMLTVLQSR